MTAALAWMDSHRIRFLKLTLSVSVFRFIFVSRPRRLFVSFLFSSTLYLAAALFLPLWVLFAGPLLLGVPHLLSSLRYIGRDFGPGRIRPEYLFASLFVAVACYRLGIVYGVIDELETAFLNGIELVALGALLIVIPVVFGRSVREFGRGLLFFVPLAYGSYFYPAATVGALVLIHNLIAFAFWFRAAKTPAEQAVAVFAAATFVSITGLIFAGVFDAAATFNQSEILGGVVDIFSIGQLVLPNAEDPMLLYHAVAAYAFGQSVHYFVWLQAIPQQNYEYTTPPTFRKSFELLKNDLGGKLLTAGAIFAAFLIGAWTFGYFQEARWIYFAAASFHGYLEIAALGFSPRNV
ncbi:MAG: hypothetical protein ABL958_00190 [Bdellovibrionia bacterium]